MADELAHALEFARAAGSRPSAERDTTNGGYDAVNRTLSELYWGRGPRDCGNYTQWVWTGAAFELRDDHTMTECWGVPLDLWPTQWCSR